MQEHAHRQTDPEPPPLEPPPKRRRGIYLLPNLFTTAGLFAGFYAIVAAMNGHFEPAAVAIFVAMAMDSIDGRVARLTHTQSDFGAEYDSLSDMVSFGIAPALVIYAWALSNFGKLGWLAAFIYTAGAALRLARFNTQAEIADKRYFQGLASPAAAGILAGLVWVGHGYGWEGKSVFILAFVLTILISALMVSNIRYHSFKQLDLKGKIPFVTLLIIVLAFVLISSEPASVLFAIFLLYAASGPAMTLLHLRKKRLQRKQPEPPSPPPDSPGLEN